MPRLQAEGAHSSPARTQAVKLALSDGHPATVLDSSVQDNPSATPRLSCTRATHGITRPPQQPAVGRDDHDVNTLRINDAPRRKVRFTTQPATVRLLPSPVSAKFTPYHPPGLTNAPRTYSNASCPDNPGGHRAKKTFYELECPSQQTDQIVVSDASMAGSQWGAFAKRRLASGETIGHYTSGSTSEPTTLTQLSSIGEYCIQVEGKQVDAEACDSCPVRFIDEGGELHVRTH